MQRTIGLLGGSFDPVHKGHLHLACEVQAKFSFDELRFIPCYQNSLKQPTFASTEDRLKMLELALTPFKNFHIDKREILKKETSYTIDTLRSFRAEFPDVSLAFIMASDILKNFHQWEGWQSLLEYAHLIFAKRPGYSIEIMSPELTAYLNEKKAHSIETFREFPCGSIFLEIISPQHPISATQIRQCIKHHKEIKTLVPTEVMKYIYNRRLYQNHYEYTKDISSADEKNGSPGTELIEK